MTAKMEKNTVAQQRIAIIKEAVSGYIRTEGCGCCRSDRHEEFEELLGELLEVPRYSDDSGYNWWSKRARRHGRGEGTRPFRERIGNMEYEGSFNIVYVHYR